ncbi:acyltransferase-domain-containing protein [Halteromyces radiatus]|uniref:acyltransferase-domain-containing protein n=1 Tax=Halteromyces radiatus TaxID=101107 RepID=UPI002220AA0E|nr:acyltransferase-domain-containing protein [Halteromyces radiatus]KAI8098887.1 acyltransferase-domain-containing protein [Halteromyces radiatus]
MAWTLREIIACTLVLSVLMFQAAIVCFATLVTFVCIWPFSKQLYKRQLTHILSYWSQNLIGLIQWLAPSQMVFYFDESCPPSTHIVKQAYQKQQQQQKKCYSTTTGELNFPDRTIIISNHQIYADWIYIWFIAYLSKAHGSLKIMLKNELKYLPFFGLGMQLFGFIFMKRRLIDDKDTIIQNLEKSKLTHQPMWLILFPEGTVISKEMRERSKAYALKNNMDDNLFTLLPRSTGLKLCTTTLGDSVEWIYDLTIGYPGIQPGEIPEDTLRLKQIFTGRGPQQIHIHMRRYRISELPLDDDVAFSKWIMDRWVEKDRRMEQFYEEGRFSSFDHHQDDDSWVHDGSPLLGRSGAHTYRVPIRLDHPFKESFGLWLYMIPYIPVLYIIYRLATYLLARYYY